MSEFDETSEAQPTLDSNPELMAQVYDELRRLAETYLRDQRSDMTLQPTALVHEAYLKLAHKDVGDWKNRAHFLGTAAQAMRQLLVDHHRRRSAGKRGGGWSKVTLDPGLSPSAENEIDLSALDEALNNLGQFNERLERLVVLRFFGGLTNEEVAAVLEVSISTIDADWSLARAWLGDALSSGD